MSTPFCTNCYSSNHIIDHTSWDRICTDCGNTSAPELELEEPFMPSDDRNPRSTHFQNTLKKLKLKGFRSQDVIELERLFHSAVQMFMETRHLHKRRYMINYPFLFSKLFHIMGYNETPEKLQLKLPKLPKTVLKLEETWQIMFTHSKIFDR
jgi:hypothetical protein